MIASRSARPALLGAVLITVGGIGWYYFLPASAAATLASAAALNVLMALIFALTVVVFFLLVLRPVSQSRLALARLRRLAVPVRHRGLQHRRVHPRGGAQAVRRLQRGAGQPDLARRSAAVAQRRLSGRRRVDQGVCGRALSADDRRRTGSTATKLLEAAARRTASPWARSCSSTTATIATRPSRAIRPSGRCCRGDRASMIRRPSRTSRRQLLHAALVRHARGGRAADRLSDEHQPAAAGRHAAVDASRQRRGRRCNDGSPDADRSDVRRACPPRSGSSSSSRCWASRCTPCR